MAKILVVSNNKIEGLSTRRILEKSNFEVHYAENGKLALELIQETPMDVVITDIFMPEMDGIETIRNLQKTNPRLPVISVLSSHSSYYLAAVKRLGSVSWLYKPLDSEKLIAAVQQALAKV